MQALQFFFDAEADTAVRRMWQTLTAAGVPSLASRTHGNHRPHVTFASAKVISDPVRRDLADELTLLSIPDLWFSLLSTENDQGPALFLSAVTDPEVLAVHTAVHDVLARRARDQDARHLPGSWVPHCPLAVDLSPTDLPHAIAALHPMTPIRARVTEIAITDTHTGQHGVVWTRI